MISLNSYIIQLGKVGNNIIVTHRSYPDSDLHAGSRVHELYPMIEQRFLLVLLSQLSVPQEGLTLHAEHPTQLLLTIDLSSKNT